MWTESIVVGSRHFAETTMQELGGLAKGRRLMESDGVFELRETQSRYLHRFAIANSDIVPENTYFWNNYFENLERSLGQTPNCKN